MRTLSDLIRGKLPDPGAASSTSSSCYATAAGCTRTVPNRAVKKQLPRFALRITDY